MYNRSGIPKHSFRFVKQLGTNAVCITLLHATNKGMNGQIIEYNGLWRDNSVVAFIFVSFQAQIGPLGNIPFISAYARNCVHTGVCTTSCSGYRLYRGVSYHGLLVISFTVKGNGK